MELSLCMIVRDEATNLPACLDSVQDLVDEMIIVDTGSTDNTIDIAEAYGAKVESYTWQNDFAIARNYGLQFAQGEWILVLDADEILDADVIPQIIELINQDQYILINLVRQEVGASQSPYSLVSRLFRKHPQIKFSRPYHAMIDDSVEAIRQVENYWQVINLPMVAIKHYGYSRNVINQKNKSLLAASAMEKFYASNPQDPYVCNKLGALYLANGDVVKGIKLLEKGLANYENNHDNSNNQLGYELHYHLGLGYYHNSQWEDSLFHYQIAVQANIFAVLKLGAYNNLGNLLLNVGNYYDAKIAYEAVITIDPNLAIGYYNLGLACKGMNDLPGAIANYSKAIEISPEYAEAHQNLGVVWLKLGKIDDGLESLQTAIDLHKKQGNLAESKKLITSLKTMGFLPTHSTK